MTAHTRNRLLLLLAGVLVAVVIVFFRAERIASVAESTFAYTFPDPVYKTETERTKALAELRELLEKHGVALDHVQLTSPTELEVETLASEQEEAEQDRKNIAAALKSSEKFKAAVESETTAQATAEKPLFTFAGYNILGPKPRVNLGLDLRGGSHLVLRCMPETEMVFKRAEDKPFVSATGAEGEKPATEGKPDKPAKPEDASAKPAEPAEKALEKLRADLEAMLTKRGVKDFSVSVVETAVTVKTAAPDEATAKQQHQIVLEFLKERFPDITPGRLTSAFIERGIGKDSTAEKVKEIIDRRVNALGVTEPVIQTQGSDRIIVELPGVKDPKKAIDMLGSTAKLEWKLLPEKYNNWTALSPDEHDIAGFEGQWVWKNEQTNEVLGEEAVLADVPPAFTGADLQPNCKVMPGRQGDWVVSFEMKPAKKTEFAQFTHKHVNDFLVILLDGRVQLPPRIKSPLQGEGIIEGNFTADEANRLMLLLNAGALPVRVEVAENRTVSATLGKGSMEQSLRAGLLGLALVLIFMAVYYKVPGLLADLALLIYILFVMAVLIELRATLTLPGIAGIVLSIGMAVDANVIIFERLKEELETEKTMRSAVEAAFTRAWTAILDGNVTTLIAAAVLFFLGTSLIKGFAVTLFIGVCCSMLSAIVVTRLFMDLVAGSRLGANRALFGGRRVAE
jgi:preprotein translocase subunit SecD